MTTIPQMPFSKTTPLEIPSALRGLQRGTVHRVRTPTGDEAWLVRDYAQVRSLFDDDRLGRAHPDPDNAPRVSESALMGMMMVNYDTEAADQAQMRAMLQPHFSPKHLQALRPRVEALTAGLLDELESQGSPADLHSALAEPLPILVICELLGVPYSDRDQFRAWAVDAGSMQDRARSQAGMTELFGYSMQLVQHKHAHPGDDVISRLCATEGLDDMWATMLSLALLWAGHESTVVQIETGALLLLANRDQWQALQDEPERIPKAVEELLRAATMAGNMGGLPRYARTDFEIDGVNIRQGDLVLLDVGSANYDPAVFTDPERLDVTRKQTAHLAFGFGSHYCVGAALARMELNTVFTQLIQRFPSMQLACDPATLPVRDDVLTGGLTQLPVSW